MADGSLARRYARALIGIGRETQAVDQIGRELARFSRQLKVGGLGTVLDMPGLTLGERRAVLDQVLSRIGLGQVVENFLRLLLDKQRFSCFDDIEREYRQMADELTGRVRASVTAARPLGASERSSVQSTLESATGKTVVVSWHTDPTLIGGIVAQVGDMVYDASVSTRLVEMRSVLMGKAGEA